MNMVSKIRFGNPVPTGAVENKTADVNGEALLRYFEKTERGFRYRMGKNDAVYGLGEANRGINKRGYQYVSYCTDDPNHTEEKLSLYGAHNFIVIDGDSSFGVFIDNPGKVTFDIGYEKTDELNIIPEYEELDFYIIEGDGIKDIVRQFRALIGQSYIPPRWAFGYQQCRWSYMDADAVREVVDGYENCGIPLTAVYLDIDYMEAYKDFTISDERFPDFGNFVKEMKAKNIHLVPIIDAGVKIEEGYDVYEEGAAEGYFVKDKEGKDYVTAVWPGLTHFPDFLNSEARRWFGLKYKTLTDKGIDGFWNDMNEPAIFYTERGIEEVKGLLKPEAGKEDISTDKLMELKWKLNELANNDSDYKAMYHNMDGQLVNHDRVHNLYGYNMTKAAAEGLAELRPGERTLLFSRSSYIGMHRYGGIWMGDNQAWWSHILLNLKMLPSLNMCGFLYIGADIGGFGSNTTRELLLRWLALGVFTPLMRNHAALGTRLQECFRFEHTEDFKSVISCRYRLLPYLYSEYFKSVYENEMMFRPLAFDYSGDEISGNVEDQLMLGNEVMIAPVYTQNASGRYVYLPENMTMIVMHEDGEEEKAMDKGIHFVEMPLNRVVFFVKADVKIPVVSTDYGRNVCNGTMENIAVSEISWLGKKDKRYRMYMDNGHSQNKKDDVLVMEL